MKTLAEQ